MKIRRRYIFVVAFNIFGLMAMASLALLGVYSPAWQFPDVYAPYLLVVGPAVFASGGCLSLWLSQFAPRCLPASVCGVLFVIVLPAFFDCIFGIIQGLARVGKTCVYRPPLQCHRQ